MDFTKIVPVEWSNLRVLTTSQIAEFYGCEVRHIKQNFNNNRDRFKEGKHYFKLEGADLAALKESLVDDIDQAPQDFYQALKFAPVLYLWTVRGAARHAKMLSTDKAWDIFEELEENYFNPKTSAPVIAEPVAERKCHAVFPGYACVYVLLMSNDTVKIGFSGNPRARVAKLKRVNNLTVNDLYISPFMPREVAHLIEWACQEKFSSRLVKDEFFSVAFETACAAVDHFVNAVNILSAPKHHIAIAKPIADKKFN